MRVMTTSPSSGLAEAALFGVVSGSRRDESVLREQEKLRIYRFLYIVVVLGPIV